MSIEEYKRTHKKPSLPPVQEKPEKILAAVQSKADGRNLFICLLL